MSPKGTAKHAKLGFRAYQLPGVANPDRDVVIAVHIPNDPGFLYAFWGSLDFLQSARAWANDAGHTALIAARRMAEANEETRRTWEAIGDLNTLRINLDASGLASAEQLPLEFPDPEQAYQFHWDFTQWTST